MATTPVEYCLSAICLPSSEWASWVQAIGSVLAIYAAICIAWWQRRADRVREDDRDRRHAFQQMEGLVALANYALFLIEALPLSSAGEELTKAYTQQKLTSANVVGTALHEFGPGDVPDGSALVHTLELIRCCAEVESEKERFARHYWPRGPAHSPEEYVQLDAKLADIRLRASASVGMLRHLQSKYFNG